MNKALPELGRVKKGLECCKKAGAIYTGELGITAGDECTKECPYREKDGCCYCLDHLVQDCLDRLSAQEPVKPERSGHGTTWYYCCGACGQPIDPGDPYCRKCGKKVKWDDA